MYDPLCSLSTPSRVVGRLIAPYYSRIAEQYNARKRCTLFILLTCRLGVTYSTSSDHPIAVVGVQIAEAIENANETNVINKDPDSVFISGNSRPCLVDILMFGTLRQLKDLNSLNCLASPVTTNWFNTVNDIVDLVQIRRRLLYFVVCLNTNAIWGPPLVLFFESIVVFMALEFLSKKKWNPSNIKVFIEGIGED